MEDLFKKFVYTGIGLMSLTQERLQKNIDALVANQKLSKEEGRRIVDDVVDKTETKRGEFETQLKKISDELMERFKFAKNKEVEELRQRVESLEIRLGRVKANAEATRASAPASETATFKDESPLPKRKNIKKAPGSSKNTNN